VRILVASAIRETSESTHDVILVYLLLVVVVVTTADDARPPPADHRPALRRERVTIAVDLAHLW
jgi:hypothetical protein